MLLLSRNHRYFWKPYGQTIH